MSRDVPLTLENLQQLDFGKIGAAFDAELAHCVRDCMDRPHDDRTRRVTITFSLEPSHDSSGPIHSDQINVGCEISSTTTKRRTQLYAMTPRQSGKLTFHPDSPSDPDANLLYDKAGRSVNPQTGEVSE